MVLKQDKWKRFMWVMAWLAIALMVSSASAASSSTDKAALQAKITRLTGPRDSVLVQTPDGSNLVSIHSNRERVPASILKILTSLAAIDALGEDFRFKTEFYTDAGNNLKIKGYGDPLLISEQLAVICAHLSSRLDNVENIILDDTYFSQPIRIPGRGTSLEPYDAPNGALCVNFNTVAFNRLNGQWVSDEPQTPLLPSVIPLIEASGLSSGRITLAANQDEALNYTGEMF